MNKKLSKLLIVVSIIILSCAPSSNQLKQTHPEMFDEIIGPWYILSSEKPGEIIYTITFNQNGSVTGDTKSLFGYTNTYWTYVDPNYEDTHIRKPSYIAIYEFYNTDNGDVYGDRIYFTKDKNQFSDNNNINQTYLDSIPPLGIVKIDFRMKFSGEKTYVYSHDIKVVNEIKSKYSNRMLNDKNNWSKLNKNSVVEHITFLKSVYDDSLKSIAEESLHKLLDQKALKYIQKQFKQYSKYANSIIVFQDGTEVCHLYEFVKVVILGKNNVSGEKSTLNFIKNTKYENGFDVVIGFDGDEIIFNFKPYKNNLVIMGLTKSYSVNPDGWEYAAKIAAEQFNTYPQLDYIDVDLLENL